MTFAPPVTTRPDAQLDTQFDARPDDRPEHHNALPDGGRVPALRPPLIDAHDLTRRWGKGSSAQLGVDRVSLTIERGELAAIVGPSGSGKSTLGALIAGIDRPTSGSLVVDGTRIDQLSDDRLARWRGRSVGIVFQNFHLLPALTAAENVQLALRLADRSAGRRERRDRSRGALDAVGLGDKLRRLPGQLSGGEQQRVAIARAIVTRPGLIVADEPTGSLDQASGHVVFDLLSELAAAGTTVVLITHDRQLAAESNRLIEMLDGMVEHETLAVDRGAASIARPHASTADVIVGARRRPAAGHADMLGVPS
ncbi:MAG: ABC transporter ATP-binding protein [Acidimicrobiia bacterium]|nr:ABC transporter ATP-binding protein [Acidimicrobiia bacterium]